jgi:hypothetical protein
MDNYTIILPNEKAATYKVVTFIIAIINLLAFLLMAMKSAKSELNSVLMPMGFSIMSFPFIYYFIFKKNRKIISFDVSFLMGGFVWIFLGMVFPGILLLLFSIFGFYTNKIFKLEIGKAEIIYPSFPKKHYSWNEVENLILKDNILTIDFKNNKLLQFTLNESDNKNLNEVNLNNFVQEQLIQKNK